ncbi:MAG: Hint domain-containing protein [Rhodobacteraceae bacterium]|nr:Hint domain-containing protein [Paracoccaceae bacterium]
MKTGFLGTFVLSWAQTELDGAANPSVSDLVPGAGWLWHGEAVRVDGPTGVLRLDLSSERRQMRRRAGRKLRRILGQMDPAAAYCEAVDDAAPLAESGFVLTDGCVSYTGFLIEYEDHPPLVMFQDTLPPRDTQLWVARRGARTVGSRRSPARAGAVICFAAGTLIRVPGGHRLVEDLKPGDRVETRDDGAQPVVWTGRRTVSGARLHVTPGLRPIRIATDAFGSGLPRPRLLVSPAHRLLLRGPQALALFNTPEVLVRARDLIGQPGVEIAHYEPSVTYLHVMLERHQILWANGIETESFHPADMPPDALDAEDRRRLLAAFPALASDPMAYGAHARRNLSHPETALLLHKAA